MKSKHLLLLLPAAAIAGIVFAQGPLTPPGAPAPVMKTLDQIEPRTPISSLPFIINERGSYYLTRNLHFTGPGDAILINASYVTLDLMGFTLSSSDTVIGAAIATWEGLREVEVRNGAILGGGDVSVAGAAPDQSWTKVSAGFNYGIHAKPPPFPPEPSSCHFHKLRISGCRSYGLSGGEQAVVEQVTATKNGGGIYISDAGSVTNCTASLNDGNGISASGGSVTNCVASFNKTAGIYGASVANSRATRNGNTGITSGGSVTNCVADWNGNGGISGVNSAIANSMANNNGGTGITSSGGSVTNCVASFNDSHGIAGGSIAVTNCNASSNGSHGISAPSGVVAFCKAAGNNTNNNGSVDISATGATRTGNNPAP